jgi:hypothetical protein
MRVKLITIAAALLCVWGLLIADWSVTGQTTVQQTSKGVSVSKWGTLRELPLADGRHFSDVHDGFELSYNIQGRKRSASVMKMETKRLLASSEVPTFQGNTATAVMQTTDKVLEIRSQIIFNESAGTLYIVRTFRNISNHRVSLRRVLQHVDPTVIPGYSWRQVGRRNLDRSQLTAALSRIRFECDYGYCDQLPPPCPPGTTCPKPKPAPQHSRAWLISSRTSATLGWTKPITLSPPLQERPGGEVSIAVRIKMR